MADDEGVGTGGEALESDGGFCSTSWNAGDSWVVPVSCTVGTEFNALEDDEDVLSLRVEVAVLVKR